MHNTTARPGFWPVGVVRILDMGDSRQVLAETWKGLNDLFLLSTK